MFDSMREAREAYCLCTKTQDQYADGSYARSYTLDVDASCPNHGYLLAPLEAESANGGAS